MDIGSIPVRASRIDIHTDLNYNVVVASLEMIGRGVSRNLLSANCA